MIRATFFLIGRAANRWTTTVAVSEAIALYFRTAASNLLACRRGLPGTTIAPRPFIGSASNARVTLSFPYCFSVSVTCFGMRDRCIER